METVFIDKKSVAISTSGERLVMRTEDERPFTLPLRMVKRVVIANQCTISSQAIRKLNHLGIMILFLDRRDPQSSALTCTTGYTHVARRLSQYGAATDPDTRNHCAALIVRQKIRLQKHTLKTLSKRLPVHRTQLSRAERQLADALIRLNQNDLQLSTIQGIEGASARSYFAGFTTCFAPSLDFTGRNKRPPKDPVNAVLSLTYSLMYQEATRLLVMHSLDPMIGFLHLPTFGRSSLSCDLVEVVRADIDLWVAELFLSRELSVDNFTVDKGACLLKKDHRAHYFSCYNNQLLKWQKRLRRYTLLLMRFLDQGASQ